MKIDTMFYVVSRNLGEAMLSGSRRQPKGTVYGIYATRAAAEKALEAKTSFIPESRKQVGMRVNPAIIVEL